MSNKGFHVSGVAETKMECRIARNQNNKLKNKLWGTRYKKKTWFLKNIDFKCQLYRGKSIFPKTEMLTCLTLGLKNKDLIQDYIKRLDKKEDTVLWQWKIIDLDAFRKARNDYIYN